jgi:uncharacterized membrane protein
MASPELERDDLMAALGARRELGHEAEREVLESFLDRVGTSIDARVDQRLAERDRFTERRLRSPYRMSVPLALGSMAIGIAATGAASGLDHGGALVAIVAWVVIALINLSHAANR